MLLYDIFAEQYLAKIIAIMEGSKYSQSWPKIWLLFCDQFNPRLKEALKEADSISTNLVNCLYLHRDGPLCATD